MALWLVYIHCNQLIYTFERKIMNQVFGIVFVSSLFTIQLGLVGGQECSPNQCPKSSFDVHFTIIPDKICYDIDDKVTLTCAGNMGGPPSNTCNGNGGTREGWAFPLATCEVFNCTAPTSDNLILQPNETVFEARESVTFSCEEGYELTGPNLAICDAQDTWNPSTSPMCDVTCNIPEIESGTVTPKITIKVGDTALVTCDDGFSVIPPSSSRITCKEDGTWNQIPACLENCVVNAVEHSEHTEAKNIKHGETLAITCLDGFSFDGNIEFEVTCDDGQIVGKSTAACFANCTVAGVNNSNHVDDRVVLSGQEIKIICNSGYSVDEVTEYYVNCEDGELSGKTTDTCYEDCDRLSSPDNGNVSDNYRHGTTATYSCSEGYTLNGTTEVTCENGNWNSEEVVSCYDNSVTCDVPVSSDVGLTIQPDKLSYNVNETVSYSCSDNRNIKGPAEATCTANGEWEPPNSPVCGGTVVSGIWLLITATSSLLFLLH